MRTQPRKSSDTPAPPLESNNLLACPSCHQEMLSPDEDLPLHMACGKTCIGSGTPGAPTKFGQQIRSPLTIPDVDQFSVSEILSADSCLSCGGKKTPGEPICRTCHGLLPFLHQKMLPAFMRGYLFADEKLKVDGHYDKKTFMEVFKSALTELAALRGGREEQTANSNQQSAGGE